MDKNAAIAIVGTFDSKGEEHLFLKKCIERRRIPTLTINVGTNGPSPFPADIDLYSKIIKGGDRDSWDRDEAIQAVLSRARILVRELYRRGKICGIISAGGGTGTHLGTSIMHVLPMGVPKVMISTVASRDMAKIVGTKDITMIHSVVDLLGVNSISGGVLFRAAGAVCGMVMSRWRPKRQKKRVALTMFGFITQAAESIKGFLEEMGYEVIAFHANGTGGMAMEELAAEGYFDGILDLATHELADELMHGYCAGIGPERLEPASGQDVPRLVVPGGLDCAVLEFTRNSIPEKFKGRKIFFYDFRSAIRLDREETLFLAGQLAEKLNHGPFNIKVLIPMKGWSEADCEDGPLYDPQMRGVFIKKLRQSLNSEIEIEEADLHINDPAFALLASTIMDKMLKNRPENK
ncbi:MAG: Tm-1-like ATP-binding domain-containing protein [Deltaproteobacteria bacterium]|nr:Tm-1-like ATP-binding domain-containing protein [Deltaproteobacteria bacterium]MBW1911203.1 Tm-1-like ATP-binding domain-containing protein [Deltaproteobacteria bacterium]MBW2035376.1 Tm-1-like ATP-binding domain-containing protein [Deltaproteobacteria bacterium]